MKKEKKTIKYLLTALQIMWLSSFFISNTYAQTFGFHDFENSTDNILSTTTLDLVTYSDEDHFSDNYNEMSEGDTTSRDIFIQNVGELPFLYKQEYIFNSGDLSLCSALELKVIFKYYDTGGSLQTEEKYDGPLPSYSINFSGGDSSMMIPNSYEYYPNSDYDENKHWFTYEITIPEDVPYDVSSKTCEFTFRTIAWQEDFADESLGFWDEEEISNVISSGDWVPPEPTEITIYDHEDTDLQCNGITNDAHIKIDWNDSTAFDFDYYHLERFEDILVAYPTESEYSMELPEDGEYMFRVRNIDTGANASEWSDWCTVTLDTSIPDFEEGDVIINEVMWGGSSEHVLDGYIELFNDTDDAINLEGWFIYGSASSFHPIELSGTIEAHAYYLVTHYPSDHEKAAILDTLGQDQVDSSLHLRTQGEKLTVEDPLGHLIDETPDAGPGGDGWAAGESSPHGPWRSMERDNDGHDWHSSCQNEVYWDDDGGDDYGTPGDENSGDECEIVIALVEDEELLLE